MSFDIRRLTPAYIAAAAVALLSVWLLMRGGSGQAEIVKRAANIDNTTTGVGGIVDAAGALTTPMLVAAGAITPLVVIGGGIAMAFGSRRGMTIILTALGTLAVLGSATAIVG